MLDSITLSISIDRCWRSIYEAIWRPEDFAKWASGLSHSPLIQEGEWWVADGPEGPIRIRFTQHNDFGVMDHTVDLGKNGLIYVPMRLVPNEEGTEVMLTLFRHAAMTDERWAADQDWVRRDLLALKKMVSS